MSAPSPSAVKDHVAAAITEHRACVVALAHDIHQHPELAFAEV